MNKKKFLVLAILMVALIVLSSALFVACNKNDAQTDSDTPSEESETIEPTEGLLIANSDFKVVSTDTESYPRTITSWSGAKTYSSGSYESGVIAGAISLEEALYAANKSTWKDTDDKGLYAKLTAGGRYGDDDKIKHALMIYMPKADESTDSAKYGPTAYGYTSASFTIAAHAYYKLSVDVLTYDIAGDSSNSSNVPGARIYLSSDTYAVFDKIDTKGEWKTYELFIEGSASASSSLTLNLSLGNYSSTYRDGLTTGYAFFDNVVLEKLDNATAASDYAAAVERELNDNTYVQTNTLKMPNGRFDFGTTTLSSTSAPSNWSAVTGNKSEDDPAPTSLGYNAVIDASKFSEKYNTYSSTYYLKADADSDATSYVPAKELSAIETLIGTLPANSIGTNVFMLSQQLMTASGIRSSKQITIERNKVYAISANVFTYGVHGAGASLVLTGADGKDITIKGISANVSDNALIGSTSISADDGYVIDSNVPGASTMGWKTYTFYVIGDDYKDYNYNVAIWLGTDGTSKNTAVSYKSYSSGSGSSNSTTYTANGTFANGWVFVDSVSLAEIAESDIPAATDGVEYAGADQILDLTAAGKSDYVGICVDLSTENIFSNAGNGNDLTIGNAGTGTQIEGNGTTQAGVPNGWKSNFDVTSSSSPVISGGIVTDGLVQIDTEDSFTQSSGKGTYPGMPYDIETKTAYMMHASKDAYYEVETAPFEISANGFYRLSLWVKTVDVKSTSGVYVYLLDEEGTTVSSFTAVNTKDSNEYTSDWRELTFVIRGSKEAAENFHLKFTLGTGDRWTANTLTSGAAFVSNMSLTSINYKTFSGTTTGTYVKSIDRTSSSTYTFTNGSFDEYKLDDDKLDPTKALKDQSVLANPTSWTISDDTLKPNSSDSKLVAGVFALENQDRNLYFNHSAQTSAAFSLVSAGDFDAFYGDESADTYLSSANLDTIGGPNVLAIASNDSAEKYAVGYASSKFTLSSNGIYSVSVFVKGMGAEKASIYLSGEAATSVESGMFTIGNPSSDWTKYTFFVKVGPTSVSLSLNLWLGYDNKLVGLDSADDAKSAGAVFFDNIIKKSVSESDFAAAEEAIEAGDTKTKAISFVTDSFDSLSDTVESRAQLSSANGWSGAAGTDQTSSNTKSGVIYADSNFYSVNAVDGTDYVGILGKAYVIDDITLTPEEAEGKTEEEQLALREEKLLALKKANWLPVSSLTAHSGKNLLVINNMEKSAYTYTSNTRTLDATSFYKVSVWAKTFGMNDDADCGAYIELYLGSANETDNPLVFKAQAQAEWTEYTFFVKTLSKSVTSVTVKLGLGSVVKTDDATTGLTSGYAFFDDVTLEKTTEAEYEAAKESASATVLAREVKEAEEEETPDTPDDTTPEKKFNLEYLWWMIPTIILAVLIIIVVIVFLFKKIRKPHKKEASNSSKETLAKKRSRYDDNKE